MDFKNFSWRRAAPGLTKGQDMLSPWKILIIAAVILLIFGGRKLPELGKQLGSAISNFRSTVKDKEGDSDGGEASKKTEEK